MTQTSELVPATTDFTAIKAKQQAMWASGDYSKIGVTLQLVGERLVETMDLRAGQRVLDVAAGNGNVSLAAARAGCDVVASDYVPELLERARARALADGLPLETAVADAEALPFADGSFDAVVSTFGVMFAPDHASAAKEMRRVVRPGGSIGLANWTPDGFVGELFKVVGSFAPPPKGVRPAALWGTVPHLRELFGSDVVIRATPRTFAFRYRSALHFVAEFRNWYGPTKRAFELLPDADRPRFAEALLDLCKRFDRAHDGTLVAPGTYLEIVIDTPPAH